MERGFTLDAAVFAGLVDLAAEKLGGKVLMANDEFFAEKENLIKPGRGVYILDKYTERGKWMDGWETRRKRGPGYDWCIIKLGAPGALEGVDIDTNHFLGNHPPYASIDAIHLESERPDAELPGLQWEEILAKSPLKQGAQNIFAVADKRRWTHVRLNIYPDGGVARLKVYGHVQRDFSGCAQDALIDLAAVENGGMVTACNDMFFGNMNNMIMPGRGANMGDGWETRRRRDPGHDWAVVRLAQSGMVRKIEVDTDFYKGNFPDCCWIDGCYAPKQEIDTLNAGSFEWSRILASTKLQADHRHLFEKELRVPGPCTHIRLSIAPDGGISRFRVFCTLAKTLSASHAGERSDELNLHQRA